MLKKISASILAVGVVFLGVPVPGWADDLISVGGTIESSTMDLVQNAESSLADQGLLALMALQTDTGVVEPTPVVTDASATDEPVSVEPVAMEGITDVSVTMPVATDVVSAPAAPVSEYIINMSADGLVELSIRETRRFEGWERAEFFYDLSTNNEGFEMNIGGRTRRVLGVTSTHYDQNGQMRSDSLCMYDQLGPTFSWIVMYFRNADGTLQQFRTVWFRSTGLTLFN